jgi:lysophospholipase L1-like esterase
LYTPFVGRSWEAAGYATGLQATKQWASAAQVPFLDLTPDFTSATGSNLQLDGMHLTVAGHRLIANVVERDWLASPLFRK